MHRHGEEIAPDLRSLARPSAGLRVLSGVEEQPFSKGVLARSIRAAGIDLDHAYRLVGQLETRVHDEALSILPRSELILRVSELLEKQVGAHAARRYRIVRRIRRLPKPLVVYIGGASGAGKSYLALELASLLRIYRVINTDAIRQVMRMLVTPAILPALHRSSFEPEMAFEAEPAGQTGLSLLHLDSRKRLLAAFHEQATLVSVGIRAVVERAIAENMSVIVEGVHVDPARVPFPEFESSAYQVPLILGTSDREVHRVRLLDRSRVEERRADRSLQSFDAIRTINDHLLQMAEAKDLGLVDTSAAADPAINAVGAISAML